MTLPGGASQRLNLLLLSPLVPVVTVGVFCVIGFYSFLGVPLCPNRGFPSDVHDVSCVNWQWWKDDAAVSCRCGPEALQGPAPWEGRREQRHCVDCRPVLCLMCCTEQDQNH